MKTWPFIHTFFHQNTVAPTTRWGERRTDALSADFQPRPNPPQLHLGRKRPPENRGGAPPSGEMSYLAQNAFRRCKEQCDENRNSSGHITTERASPARSGESVQEAGSAVFLFGHDLLWVVSAAARPGGTRTGHAQLGTHHLCAPHLYAQKMPL